MIRSHLLSSFSLCIILMFISLPFNPLLAQEWSQIGADIEGEAAFDNSGHAISMNDAGTIIIIGAPGNSSLFSTAGHARVFELLDGAWQQKGDDIDGEAEFDGSGYSVAMNSSGSIIAVGAPSNADGGSAAGHVRVYEWEGNNWFQKGSDIDGTANYSQSGFSLALSANGNTLIIGADRQDDTASNSGQIRVFEWSDDDWSPKGAAINGDEANNNFGHSTSISDDGNTIIVGAPLNSGVFVNGGQVKVFEWLNNAWTQKGSTLFGEDNFDLFGYSVNLTPDGNTLAAGAINNSSNGTNSGHARVFVWNNNDWEQKGADIDGEALSDNSGFSISISADGNTLAVGAKSNDGTFGANATAGQVRVYRWENDEWIQFGDDIDGTGDSDFFGQSVALSADGTTLAAGAHFNSGNGTSSGHVRVFSAPTSSIPTSSKITVGYKLYPNPNEGWIQIESNQVQSALEVRIFNAMGMLISSKTFTNSKTVPMHIAGSPGMYFIHIKTPDNLGRTFSVIKR